MREILFKGAQKVDGSKSLYWYEGSLVIETDSYTGEKEYYIQNESGSYLVIPETVGQYTGLMDKNGKKIFEGDIVKTSTGGIFKIVFYKSCFAVENITGTTKSNLFAVYDLEVIGNIHDNPELIKTTE